MSEHEQNARRETNPPAFRPATIDEYTAWLRKYVEAGGVVTHAYDHPFARIGMVTALRDFTTDDECGAEALKIVVPDGVRWLGGTPGHNVLFFMHAPGTGRLFVPSYDDHEFDDIPTVAAARAKAAEKRAQLEDEMRSRRRPVSDVSAYVRARRRNTDNPPRT